MLTSSGNTFEYLDIPKGKKMMKTIQDDYEKLIYHFIHKYKLTYDSDEFYQLAMIKLWELEQSYDPKKTPQKEKYMYTKLNFYFIDEIRKLAKRTERFVVTDDEFMKQNMTVADHYDAILLHEIQSMLTEKEYTCLLLTLQGYKMKEIAATMQLSVSAIKKYKKQTKSKLSHMKNPV